ncbi:MAG: hypothetical protein R2873_28860 [Caldilineaceae bacterium]
MATHKIHLPQHVRTGPDFSAMESTLHLFMKGAAVGATFGIVVWICSWLAAF